MPKTEVFSGSQVIQQQVPPQQSQTIIINTPEPSQALPAIVCFFFGGIGQLIQGRVFSSLIWILCDILMVVAIFISIGLAIPAALLNRVLNILDAALYKPSKGFRIQPLTVAGASVLAVTYFLIILGWVGVIASSDSSSAPAPAAQPEKRQKKQVRVEKPKNIAALENFTPFKANNAEGGNYFTFEVPEEAALLTLWTKSIDKSEKHSLYVNSPDTDGFPSSKQYEITVERTWGDGIEKRIAVPSPKPGAYKIYVSSVDGGGDYSMIARWQKPTELKIGDKIKVFVKVFLDDGASGWKYFFFDIPDNIDNQRETLHFQTISTFKSSPKSAIYLNGPEDGKYPSENSHRWSTQRDNMNMMLPLLTPHRRDFKPGRYYAAVKGPLGNGDEDYTVFLDKSDVVQLKANTPFNSKSKPGGDFYIYDAPRGHDFSIVSQANAWYAVYVNEPDMEKFPTKQQHQLNKYGQGEEKINVKNSKAGLYYIWVAFEHPGNYTNYSIEVKR